MKGNNKVVKGKKNVYSIAELLDRYENLGAILNWNSSDLTDVDRIVKSLTTQSLGSVSNPYDIIQKFTRYDSELVSRSLHSNEYTHMVRNLQGLYDECLQELLLRQESYPLNILIEWMKNASTAKAFIAFKSINDNFYMGKTFANILTEFIVHSHLSVDDAASLIKFHKVGIITESKWKSNDLECSDVTRNHSPTAYIITKISELWSNDNQKAIELLDFFISQGLSLNEPSIYDNAIAILLRSKLIIAQGNVAHQEQEKKINLELIEALLQRVKNVDANVMYDQKKSASLFSIAAGTGNIEAVKLFLRYGATPYLSEQESIKRYGKICNVLDTLELNSNIPDQNKKEVYIENTRIAIEMSLLERALGIAPKPVYIESPVEVVTNTDNWLEDAPKKKQHQKSGKKAKSKKNTAVLPKEAEPKTSGDDETQVVTSSEPVKTDTHDSVFNPKAAEDYIAYLSSAQHNDSISDIANIENQLTISILTNAQENARTLLENNLWLYAEPVSDLLNDDATDTENDIPNSSQSCDKLHKQLHKIYLLRKQEINKATNQNESKSPAYVSAELAPNVYEVESRSHKRIFIKISDEMKGEMKFGRDDSKLKKLHTIDPKSKGENGLKIYDDSVIKLKLNQEDSALYATKKFISPNGDVLIVFEGEENHTRFKRKINDSFKIKTTYLEYNELLYNMVYEEHNTYTSIDYITELDDNILQIEQKLEMIGADEGHSDAREI